MTSTADDGPGSLREALEASGPRFVLARTDGVIDLSREIKVSSGDITLDLRRPPGGGLTIHGFSLVFGGVSNVVALGVRYRGTNKLLEHADQTPADCLNFTSVQRGVIAHSSFFGCVDEAVSIERAGKGSQINADITVQHNLFLEQCMFDCQVGQEHARPINVSRGWDRVAVHHNLLVGSERRQPQMTGCNGHPECANVPEWPLHPTGGVAYNLIGHWTELAAHADTGARADYVGNVFIPGSQAWGSAIVCEDEASLGTEMFLQGNEQCDSWSADCAPAMSDANNATIATEPLAQLELTSTDASALRSEAWLRTLGPDVWDAEDERVLAELMADAIVPGGGYVPDDYVPPAPAIGVAPPDADADGLPDDVDPEPVEPSAWDDSNSDGWTDLEAYLSCLVIE